METVQSKGEGFWPTTVFKNVIKELTDLVIFREAIKENYETLSKDCRNDMAECMFKDRDNSLKTSVISIMNREIAVSLLNLLWLQEKFH